MILNFIYTWLNLLVNVFFCYFYLIKHKIFFISNFRTQQHNLIFMFYLFYYFNFITYFNYFNNLYNKNINLLKITYFNGKHDRSIILQNNSIKDIVLIANNIYKYNFLHDENEISMMSKIIILDIYYIDNYNNKVSIKNLLNKYADKSKNIIQNSIHNILEIENIYSADINKIYIQYFKFKKIEKEIDITYDNFHVTHFFNI